MLRAELSGGPLDGQTIILSDFREVVYVLKDIPPMISPLNQPVDPSAVLEKYSYKFHHLRMENGRTTAVYRLEGVS